MHGEANGKRIEKLALGASLIVLALALLLCVLYWVFWRGVTTLDPKNYTTLFRREEDGAVVASLNLSEMLADLHLPDLRGTGTDSSYYPDIEALEKLELSLGYSSDGSTMTITLSGDMDTLERYGIALSPLTYEMDTPSYEAPDTRWESVFEGVWNVATPALQEGYLTSLLDEYGRGYNLRNVCEEVHRRRDLVVTGWSQQEYTVEKTQVSFILFPAGGRMQNCYRAVYAIRETGEEASASLYLVIEVQDLAYSREEGVTFNKSVITLPATLTEAESLESYKAEGCTCTVLYGGGVVQEDREVFDQNGFVRFYGMGTSYKLANGLYWSPTYDLLEEDSIWQLTANGEYSLAKLLRYARKEIYARHFVRFNKSTEGEFYRHFTAYNWYEEQYGESEITLSEAEQANIRLLREIQSLIEK